MNQKTYFLTAAILFTFAALIHLTRVIKGWDLQLGPYLIPVWLSGLLVILAGFSAFSSFKYYKK
jgi:hypothetical protein